MVKIPVQESITYFRNKKIESFTQIEGMVMDEKFHEKTLNFEDLIPAAPNIQHADVRALNALHNLSK